MIIILLTYIGDDSPRRGCARHPSLRFAHRGDKKMRSTLFAALAGERVGQRSVAGVSRSRRSKPMSI